ncbi:AraC family transcriptional regulator [Aeromonas bivalvium]|uniref:AraC family transcriptional regulator n=1 Tax=Aeromonas bivalvium TaxID=440079 RepID=UPI0038D1C1E9
MSRLLHAVVPADKCLPEPAHFTRIERVLNHIHQHLDAPLSVSELAELSCWSRWQLQRVFHNETGLTVAAYVRELKLSQAAAALLDGRERVLDLALRHGYDAEASFSRAFKQQFGCSPLAYRKRGLRIGLRLPIQQIAARSGEGRWLQVRVETRPAFHLMGGSGTIHGLFADAPDFQHRVPAIWQGVQALPGWAAFSDRPLLGVSDLSASQGESQGFPYWAGIEQGEGIPALPGAQILAVPSQTYGVIRHQGPIGELPRTLSWFIEHWLPQSGYRGLDGLELEAYPPGYRATAADACMHYWLPIAPLSSCRG